MTVRPVLQNEGLAVGAELGVLVGEFAEVTLQKWTSCTKYYLVDLWGAQVRLAGGGGAMSLQRLVSVLCDSRNSCVDLTLFSHADQLQGFCQCRRCRQRASLSSDEEEAGALGCQGWILAISCMGVPRLE